MQFPRLVYQLKNKVIVHELVQDTDEFDSAIKKGWFENVPDALAGESSVDVAKADSLPPTRSELETQAKELGIKFDGRTADAKLLTLINDALEK
jgi:hypothetical protein